MPGGPGPGSILIVVDADLDAEKRATTANQLLAGRDRLRELASAHGLSELRLASDGTLFVHVDRDPGYRPVLRFVEEATKSLGAEPNVVVDDAPAAKAKLPTASRL